MSLADALANAWVRSRQEKSNGFWGAGSAALFAGHFDSACHAAYYAVFHATLANTVQMRLAKIRMGTQIFRHREVPGFFDQCVAGATFLVTQGGASENYQPIEAVIELQSIRRTADYETPTNDRAQGEKAYQLAQAILEQLRQVPQG